MTLQKTSQERTEEKSLLGMKEKKVTKQLVLIKGQKEGHFYRLLQPRSILQQGLLNRYLGLKPLPKKCRNMVVFQDSSIIIEIGQSTPRIDVKVIGGSCMVIVMDNGSHQGGEDFQVGHPILKWISNTDLVSFHYQMYSSLHICIFFC